jgi:hypothetical protein
MATEGWAGAGIAKAVMTYLAVVHRTFDRISRSGKAPAEIFGQSASGFADPGRRCTIW